MGPFNSACAMASSTVIAPGFGVGAVLFPRITSADCESVLAPRTGHVGRTAK
jgi:hypothetical protein